MIGCLVWYHFEQLIIDSSDTTSGKSIDSLKKNLVIIAPKNSYHIRTVIEVSTIKSL